MLAYKKLPCPSVQHYHILLLLVYLVPTYSTTSSRSTRAHRMFSSADGKKIRERTALNIFTFKVESIKRKILPNHCGFSGFGPSDHFFLLQRGVSRSKKDQGKISYSRRRRIRTMPCPAGSVREKVCVCVGEMFSLRHTYIESKAGNSGPVGE